MGSWQILRPYYKYPTRRLNWRILKKTGFYSPFTEKRCRLYVPVCIPIHQAREEGRLTLD